MTSLWDGRFIVIDVETTGGHPQNNRIMDIACVTTVGGVIVDKYSSLINPHQFIPPFIASMTGISNEMVYNAPEAYDILKKTDEILRVPNSIFVAHNLQFDWGFVKADFERNEIEFPAVGKLCTLKLSRRLLKKEIKKNVGSLAEYFGVIIKNRHRALGDAEATSKILCELMDIAEDEHGVQTVEELIELQNKQIKNFLPPSATYKRLEEKIDALPESPGVYYFKDKNEKVHYVGKAKCLKERVKSYFQYGNVTSRKISAMLRKTHFLDWECVDSELSALIKESAEIKAIQPYYNTLDKNYRKYPFIKVTKNEEYPRIEVTYTVEEDGAEYFGPFRGYYLAEIVMEGISKRYKIRKCDGALKPNPEFKPCFYSHIERCGAPCALKITKEEYLKDVEEALLYLSGKSDGAIYQLEKRMLEYSENLEFEKAAEAKKQLIELKKLFERQSDLPVSINSSSFIAIMKDSDEDKTIKLLMIRFGKLIGEYIIGRKAPLNYINSEIKKLYFDAEQAIDGFDKKYADELKIINAWIFKHRNELQFVYFANNGYEELTERLEDVIRHYPFEEDEESEDIVYFE
jgi:DNA polymerase-3 subunit epsilon